MTREASLSRGLDCKAVDRVPADLCDVIRQEGLPPGNPDPKEWSGLDLRRRFLVDTGNGK